MKKYKYFTEAEYLKGREKDAPLTEEMKENMHKLLTALDGLREAYGKSLIISSGYRPETVNKAAGGSKKSAHLTCEACDFKDPDKSLAKFCVANLELLQKLGLYMENPVATSGKSPGGGWVHLQTRKTASGKIIFNP